MDQLPINNGYDLPGQSRRGIDEMIALGVQMGPIILECEFEDVYQGCLSRGLAGGFGKVRRNGQIAEHGPFDETFVFIQQS